MKLRMARTLFNELRKEGRITILRHAWQAHPNRGFTRIELVKLVQGSGNLQLNLFPSAQVGSFLWICKDLEDRRTEIAIVIETEDNGDSIVIIHAFRKGVTL